MARTAGNAARTWLSRASTLARDSNPISVLSLSPNASTRAESDVRAAKTREILPLFLVPAWPTSDAW
jgi:hypothetical protein